MKKIITEFNEVESFPNFSCYQPGSLQSEVESLKQKIFDRDLTIIQLEAKMTQELPQAYSQGQLAALRATCDNWQDKYNRLLEAHKRVQRVNQGLEDKLLRLVDRMESEKASLSQDVANLTTALTTAAQAINRLKTENARYQNDLGVVVQLLQCNSSQYTAQRLNNLPSELHQKVKPHVVSEIPKPPPKSEAKILRVPIPTFPPTAMVYSSNKCEDDKEECSEPVDVVSAAIMAAILEEREREKSQRHCPTCTCKLPSDTSHSIKTKDLPFREGKSLFRAQNQSAQVHHQGGSSSVDIWKYSQEKNINSGGLGVIALDIGTQTIPSYIGETGKVHSTCIYCRSNKPASDKGIDSGIEESHSNAGEGIFPQDGQFVGHSLANENCKDKVEHQRKSSYSWDWLAESQDSGSPPTPTSITSPSHSYESEMSNFTSPQDSPGRLSLQDKTQEGKSLIPREDMQSYKLLEGNGTSSIKMMRNCGKRIDKTYNISPFSEKPHYIVSQDPDAFTIPIHLFPPTKHNQDTVSPSRNESTDEKNSSIKLINNKVSNKCEAAQILVDYECAEDSYRNGTMSGSRESACIGLLCDMNDETSFSTLTKSATETTI